MVLQYMPLQYDSHTRIADLYHLIRACIASSEVSGKACRIPWKSRYRLDRARAAPYPF